MASADRPISAVLHDIVGNVQDIVRSEMRLAKTEVTEELGKARSGAVLAGLGVLMIAFSVMFVLLAIFYALSLVMPAWAAALVIALVEGAIAVTLMLLGIQRFKKMRAVPRTTASVKENVEWAKQLSR